jgi:hypothetical protein
MFRKGEVEDRKINLRTSLVHEERRTKETAKREGREKK